MCLKQARGPHDRTPPQLHEPADSACRSLSKEECIADCIADDRCACAFFREPDSSFAQPYCALTTVPCNDPGIGAIYNNAQTHTALLKCAAAAPEVAEPGVEEPYEAIDWYGVWDYVCESPNPFEHQNANTLCGPSCVLDGTYTTMCAPPEPSQDLQFLPFLRLTCNSGGRRQNGLRRLSFFRSFSCEDVFRACALQQALRLSMRPRLAAMGDACHAEPRVRPHVVGPDMDAHGHQDGCCTVQRAQQRRVSRTLWGNPRLRLRLLRGSLGPLHPHVGRS